MGIRIQFDLTDEEWEPFERYISNIRLRHIIGKDAFKEWLTRKEGKDRKLVHDRRMKDKLELEPIMLDILKSHGLME